VLEFRNGSARVGVVEVVVVGERDGEEGDGDGDGDGDGNGDGNGDGERNT